MDGVNRPNLRSIRGRNAQIPDNLIVIIIMTLFSFPSIVLGAYAKHAKIYIYGCYFFLMPFFCHMLCINIKFIYVDDCVAVHL